jgi:membrane-associated phospholipid phosphatase
MSAQSAFATVVSRYTYHGDFVEPASVPALSASALFLLVILGGVITGVVRVRVDELSGIALPLATLWGCGIGCQIIGASRAGQWLKMTSIFFVMAGTGALASAVLARVSAPYADSLFIQLDHALFFGFDWKGAVNAIDQYPRLDLCLSYAYNSLSWQPQALTAYFCATGRPEHPWRALSMLAVALVLCIFIFPFCPAVGGYAYFGIPWNAVPNVLVGAAWKYPVLLQELKAGQVDYLGLRTLEGIVAMPSFHASCAVILAWAFWSSLLLRLPFLVLNATMLVSTVPIGGHYIVDVVAGMLTATSGISAVTLAGSRLPSRTRRTS